MMNIEDALREIRTKPLVPLWPHLGLVFDMSRGSVYAAARTGQFDIFRYGKDGKRMKALTAPIRKRLGMDAA